jgi:aminomuconate-semialdehyde/2-hydroxymuconate-6-semialdehyde dehydrogenase
VCVCMCVCTPPTFFSFFFQSGTVWVNCWLQRDLRMPFGGMKQSGVGREGGSYSIEFFTDHKTVCMSCL